MNEMTLARSGYQSSIATTGDDRSTEYRIFARVTQELSTLDEKAPDYHTKKAIALHRNLRLWTLLAVDVANDNNQLPAPLRSSLFYLAEFTRHHTAKVHAGEADPKMLIEINTSVMRGLRQQATAQGEG